MDYQFRMFLGVIFVSLFFIHTICFYSSIVYVPSRLDRSPSRFILSVSICAVWVVWDSKDVVSVWEDRFTWSIDVVAVVDGLVAWLCWWSEDICAMGYDRVAWWIYDEVAFEDDWVASWSKDVIAPNADWAAWLSEDIVAAEDDWMAWWFGDVVVVTDDRVVSWSEDGLVENNWESWWSEDEVVVEDDRLVCEGKSFSMMLNSMFCIAMSILSIKVKYTI